MPTVAELSDPYANYLLPVLATTPGVCEVCRTSVAGDYPRCHKCNDAAHVLDGTADAVVPIALATKGEQFAHELWAYKNSPNAGVRRRFQFRLAAVLWRWLDRHERCVAAAAGASAAQFSLVTVVPASRVRDDVHPLARLVGELVAVTRERYRPVLVPTPGVAQERQHDCGRYGAASEVVGQDVLVVDDTWTTGGHAQSAACALKAGGASSVAVVVLGRHFSLQQQEPYRAAAAAYYREAKRQGWNWEVCAVERGHP